MLGGEARVRALRLNVLFISACCFFIGCAHSPTSLATIDTAPIEREDAQFALAADTRCIDIDNPYGDLHLRAGEADKLAYHAVIQHIDQRLPRPRIVQEHTGCARLVVRIEGQRPTAQKLWNARRARVDLALAVPPELSVSATTGIGAITAKRIGNALRVSTVSGAIQLSTGGDLDVESVSGAIALTAWHGAAARRWTARTLDGPIRAFVEPAVVALRAETCGVLKNAFDSTRDAATASGCKALRIGGSPEPAGVRLFSNSGDIEVYRLEP